VPLFKIFFVICARAFSCAAARQRHLAMMELFWPRAVRRRSRIFERELRRVCYRVAALIFHGKCVPTVNERSASQHSGFELILLTPMRLLPSRAWLVWFTLRPFYKQLKNKQQTAGGKSGNRTTRSALVTAHGGTPGPAADSATSRAERRQPAM
jgi:hypothetical protein